MNLKYAKVDNIVYNIVVNMSPNSNKYDSKSSNKNSKKGVKKKIRDNTIRYIYDDKSGSSSSASRYINEISGF